MYVKLHLYGGRIITGLFMAIGACFPAVAQNASTPTKSPLANLYACQNIENPNKKNECYDLATTALQIAEKQGEIVALDRDALKEIQEGIFGYKYAPFSNPRLEHVKRTSPLKTVTVPVKKVERYLSGYVITLDNNQVWEQFAGSISRVPKGQLSAEINTTPTGAYKMALFNAKTRVTNIRVRRIQ